MALVLGRHPFPAPTLVPDHGRPGGFFFGETFSDGALAASAARGRWCSWGVAAQLRRARQGVAELERAGAAVMVAAADVARAEPAFERRWTTARHAGTRARFHAAMVSRRCRARAAGRRAAGA